MSRMCGPFFSFSPHRPSGPNRKAPSVRVVGAARGGAHVLGRVHFPRQDRAGQDLLPGGPPQVCFAAHVTDSRLCEVVCECTCAVSARAWCVAVSSSNGCLTGGLSVFRAPVAGRLCARCIAAGLGRKLAEASPYMEAFKHASGDTAQETEVSAGWYGRGALSAPLLWVYAGDRAVARCTPGSHACAFGTCGLGVYHATFDRLIFRQCASFLVRACTCAGVALCVWVCLGVVSRCCTCTARLTTS